MTPSVSQVAAAAMSAIDALPGPTPAPPPTPWWYMGPPNAPEEFVRGVTYNCSATSCYAITSAGQAVNADFVAFQKALNLVGGSAGFVRISTDGVLGPRTFAAYLKAVALAERTTGQAIDTPSSIVDLVPRVSSMTKELQHWAAGDLGGFDLVVSPALGGRAVERAPIGRRRAAG